MKVYGIIYCAYNKINQKRYIGQTIQRLCERRAAHYTKDPDIYFHHALHKYNKEDFQWTIIDTALSADELNQKEKYWIKQYDTLNPEKGYNLLPGGKHYNPTKEQIQYARNKFVEKYSNNINIVKKKKNILCVETREIFITAAEASRKMNIHHGHITEAANGKLNTAGGYHWEWCIDIKLYPNAIYCLELDKIYLSYNEARNEDHFSGTHLSRAFKEQDSPCTYAGYTFYKINDETP